MIVRIGMAAAVGALCLVAPLDAQQLSAKMRDSLDALVATGDVHGPALGLTIVRDGETVYERVRGYADLEHRVPADGETPFELASVAKHFTAYAIAMLVADGRVGLDRDIRDYLPEMPDFGSSVTVGHLLFHTSGIDDADGLGALTGWAYDDAIDAGDVYRMLTGLQHLRAAPGDAHAYGNAGYLLLARIVERVADRSFGQFLEEAMFAPAGMQNTHVADASDAVIRHAARSYRREYADSTWRVVPQPRYAGPGGISASLRDLAAWARSLMEAPIGGAAVRSLLDRRGRLNDGEELDYGFGLVHGTHRGLATLSHAGSGPGTQSILLWFPEQNVILAGVANSDRSPGPGRLAYQAAEVLLGDLLHDEVATGGPRMIMITRDRERPPETVGITPDQQLLRNYAGSYGSETEGFTFVIRANDGRLEFAFDGQPPYFELFPRPDGSFYSPTYDAIYFERDSEGRVPAIEIRPTERSLGGPDQPVRHLQRLDPSTIVGDAAQYIGSYFSDELGSLFHVEHDGSALALTHSRFGRLDMIPIGTDEFSVDSYLVARATFHRPGGGRAASVLLEAYSWRATSTFRRFELEPSSSR